MSIITGNLRSQDVLLVSDTLGSAAVEGYADRHVSKIYTAPHLQTIFATVGHIGLPVHLLTRIQMAELESYDFDGLVAALPAIVDQAYSKTCELIYEHALQDVPRMFGCKIIVFGFSTVHNRVRGIFFQKEAIEDDFSTQEVPPGYFAQPGIQPADMERIQQMMVRKPNPEKILIEFAKSQRVAVEAELAEAGLSHSSSKIGGRLLLTRLTRDRIEQRQIWAWPDADRLRPAGAPVGRVPGETA